MVRRFADEAVDDNLHDQDRVHMPADSFLFERVVPALLIVAATLMVVVLILGAAALAGLI
jgi:hypothetical protein